MKNHKSRITSISAALLYTLMSGAPVLADDTEVLIGPGGVTWATPNVLFIMDTSGSMARDVDGNSPPAAGEDSRLTIVQNVFRSLMNDTTYHGLNVGLMRFDRGGTGGYFVSPMQELNDTTDDTFIAAADAFTADGNTPLAETLYEATRFYRGMSVDFGDDTSPGTNHPDVVDGTNYISPITSVCQKNYVILLTDGQPTSDTAANDSIETLTGSTCTGNCLDELALFLHEQDQSDSLNDPETNDPQTVETYTIGFTTSQTLLENTASNGGGDYIVANNSDELSSAFRSILDTIANTNVSFSPPAMAANAFNNISHYNRLYYTLFEPSANPKWEGNVKPYMLAGDPVVLTDANNQPATNTNGTFRESSRSFWSAIADGGSIAEGGANGRLPEESVRNLFTFTGNYENGVPDTPVLSAASNALENSAGSSLTFGMLGLEDDTDFDSILTTIRSSTLGDPLHSKPVLVNFGGTEDNPDLTLFVATNAGFLHAINASTGVEQFAFIPQELLTNLPDLAQGTGSHRYGLDGDVTAWVNDINNDGIITSGDDEHVYVYVGMRRGGNNYYALDVTNRSAPTLKWVIHGGQGDFAELGQSWSRPEVTTINYGDSTRTVLIFGGGYDTAQDDWPVNQPDTTGRAIYVVDAETGERLWWASSLESADEQIPEMMNSIPSDIRLVDSNLDGHTDRLYVGDMDGRIFRVDLEATATGMSGSGILFADLGSTSDSDADDNRRFYYPPDVVFTQQPGLPVYVSVNIGSGYRAHPLNPVGDNAVIVNDRFYSLRDPNVIGEPEDFTAITHAGSTLLDATDVIVDTEGEIESLNASSGWFITLGNGNGEKVLSPAMTMNGVTYFTTYTPSDASESSSCTPLPGTGLLYSVSLFDATPALTEVIYDDEGNIITPSVEDRAEELGRRGIPPGPTVMFRETDDGDVEPDPCVGTECEPLPDAIKMEETYWRDDV